MGDEKGATPWLFFQSLTLIILIGIAAVGMSITSAKATIVTLPTGLNPGDQYRLVFLTSTERNATSSDIAVYNAFVTAAAAGITAP